MVSSSVRTRLRRNQSRVPVYRESSSSSSESDPPTDSDNSQTQSQLYAGFVAPAVPSQTQRSTAAAVISQNTPVIMSPMRLPNTRSVAAVENYGRRHRSRLAPSYRGAAPAAQQYEEDEETESANFVVPDSDQSMSMSLGYASSSGANSMTTIGAATQDDSAIFSQHRASSASPSSRHDSQHQRQ